MGHPGWKQLAGHISLLLSGTALARLFTAMVLIVVARAVGPASFGQYTACFTLAWLLSPLFSLGLDNWLMGYGARRKSGGELGIHASTALVIKVGLGLVWIGLILLLAPLLDDAVFPPTLLLLAAVTVWLDELGRLVWVVFETALRNRSTLVLMVTMQALVAAAVAALFIQGEERVQVYLAVQLAATGAGSLVGLFWQIRQFGFHLELERLRPTVRASVPFALSLALALIYGRADIALVAQWLGNAAAGLYAPAVSLISALVLVPLALYNVILPVLSRTLQADRSQLARLIWQSIALSLGLGVIMAGGTLLLARPVVHLLYGADYTGTVTILMILSGVLLARSVNLSAAAALIALNQQGRRVRHQAVIACLNILANLFVLQFWGIAAVAAVFVLSEIALAVAYLHTIWRTLRADSSPLAVDSL